MIALLSLLLVVAISILIVRIASAALVLTGLTKESARFQARSALSGTGFTTEEAEHVVRHPVRRRIIMLLILLQNAGLVTAISALVLSFIDTRSTTEVVERVLLLLAGLGALLVLANSAWFDRHLSHLIEWALRRYTSLEVKDFYTLLNLQHDYTVARVRAEEGSWLAGKTLRELSLPDEGILVLGINRADGSYVGAPRGAYTINAGETLVLYGKQGGLAQLRERLSDASGEAAHEQAKTEHREEMRRQDREERAYQAQQDREQRAQ